MIRIGDPLASGTTVTMTGGDPETPETVDSVPTVTVATAGDWREGTVPVGV